MKKLFPIALIVLSISAKAQLRCLVEPSYTQYSKTGELVIKKPISVCYTNNIFSFYSPVTGSRAFEISDRTTKKNKDGYVVEDFINAEGDNNMKGDYHIQITYGITKIILINFTRFGEAYLIKSKGFIGSPEQNSSTAALVKRIKTGKSPISKQAEAFIDVKKRFLDSCGISFASGRSQISCLLNISNTGEVTDVFIKNKTLLVNEAELSVENKIKKTFKDMPLWKPAVDNEGRYIQSQIEVDIIKD